MNITQQDDIGPLTPQMLQILTAVALSRSTGYDVLRQIKEDSLGRLELQSGTVYPALHRLEKDGLITETPDGPMPRPGRPARGYELTWLGQQILVAELTRLEQLTKLGRERLAEHQCRQNAKRADF